MASKVGQTLALGRSWKPVSTFRGARAESRRALRAPHAPAAWVPSRCPLGSEAAQQSAPVPLPEECGHSLVGGPVRSANCCFFSFCLRCAAAALPR